VLHTGHVSLDARKEGANGGESVSRNEPFLGRWFDLGGRATGPFQEGRGFRRVQTEEQQQGPDVSVLTKAVQFRNLDVCQSLAINGGSIAALHGTLRHDVVCSTHVGRPLPFLWWAPLGGATLTSSNLTLGLSPKLGP